MAVCPAKLTTFSLGVLSGLGHTTLFLKSGPRLPMNNTEDDNVDLRKVEGELQERMNYKGHQAFPGSTLLRCSVPSHMGGASPHSLHGPPEPREQPTENTIPAGPCYSAKQCANSCGAATCGHGGYSYRQDPSGHRGLESMSDAVSDSLLAPKKTAVAWAVASGRLGLKCTAPGTSDHLGCREVDVRQAARAHSVDL